MTLRSFPSLLCLVFAFLTPAGVAMAQVPPSVRVSLGERGASEATAQVGEPVELVVQIVGTSDAPQHRLSLPRGLQLLDSDRRISFGVSDIVHGRRVERQLPSVSFVYTIAGERAGRFRIPETTIEVSGRSLSVPPTTLDVVEPVTPEGFWLEILPERTGVFAGEPVRLLVRWTLAMSPERPRFSGDLAPEGLRLLTPEDDRWLRDAERTHRLELFDGPGFAALRRIESPGGESAFVLDVERLLVADEPGRHRLGPLTVRFRSQEIGAGRTPLSSAADAVELEVLPLPERDRPDSFYGLVGEVSVSAAADRDSVGAGEPVRLRLTIEAGEPASRITPPDLTIDERFTSGFKVPENGWALDSATPRSRTYAIALRPRDERVTEIPGVRLAYFDPRAGEYRVAEAEAIPLRVRRVREVTARDGVGVSLADADRSPLIDSEGGVRANFTGPELLVNESPDPLERLPALAWLLVIGGPPLLLVGAAAARYSRSPSREAVRRRATALGRARASMKRRAGAEGVAEAIRVFVGMRFGVEPASVTESDCRRLIAGAIPGAEGRSLGAEVGGMLAACEAQRYTGSAPATDAEPPSPKQAEELLRSIDTLTSRRGGEL
ncbi:MAG: BatD family protein [Phycisphaerales bacterium]|nr:BatD family protein [Phycisphaerales bacterium]